MVFAQDFHTVLTELASGLEIRSVSSSGLNFRPTGSGVQADVGVFGMGTLDVAAHGSFDTLA